MGLTMMGVAVSLNLASIPFIAAVISLTALINVVFAVYKNHHHIHWETMKVATIGMVPAMVGGVLLLDYLSENAVQLLQLILGTVIIISGLLLALKPHPAEKPSPPLHTLLTGVAAGLLGGMFSTGGPPLVYLMYKQPLSIDTIRSTLLSVFVIATIFRIAFIAVQGHITTDVALVVAYSIPVVFIFTGLGKKFPPPISDTGMRRTAFILLILLGFSTALTA